MNEKLLAIAREYDTPEAFKVNNHAKYSICKAKGLLRKAFPDYVKPLVVYVKPKPAKVAQEYSEASLLNDLDDLIVTYRNRPSSNGKLRTIPVYTVIADILAIHKRYSNAT